MAIFKKYLLIGLLLSVGCSAMAQDDNLYIVANTKGAPDNLKFLELKSIFSGERQRWPDKTKVILVFMKTSTPTGRTMSKKVFDMTPDEVLILWRNLIFAGKFDAPKTCNTVEEFETYIADNPGAIGISDRSADNVQLKTVKIDGKKTF